MAFSEQFIAELKLKNPIEDIMSGYVQLQRKGRLKACCCPFHSEKTPSCMVYTDDSPHFYCYGCGKGGDVITFIMEIENLDYVEAIKFLANKAGMTVPDERSVDTRFAHLKSRVLEMNRAAAKFYHDILANSRDGEKGRRYFEERQLSRNTVIKYGLGYSTADWDSLARYMRSQGYNDDELVIANLCDRGSGRVFDRFRDRVMFPIIDLRGNVIGFGGRTIDGGANTAKYLNTSDTPVFKKSQNLFSLNFAKKSKEKRLILAEGYMDVISINQAGFENVVASLGTALTDEQTRLISRYAEEVVIAYDSDEAGQKAAHKAINMFSAIDLKARVINMEGAKDPDEYIKRFGSVRFGKLIERSPSALDFELARCRDGLDLETSEGKVEYLKRAVRRLSETASSIEREVYAGRIADETSVSKEMILQQIAGNMKKKVRQEKSREWNEMYSGKRNIRNDPEISKHPKEYAAEKAILSYLAAYPEEAGNVLSKLPPERFVTGFNRKIYEKIAELSETTGFYDFLSLQSEFTAGEMGKITEIVVNRDDININKMSIDNFIDILLEYGNGTADAENLSDEDYRDFFKGLQSKK